MQERQFSGEMVWKGEVTTVAARFVPLATPLTVIGGRELGRLMFTPPGEETYWVSAHLDGAILAWDEAQLKDILRELPPPAKLGAHYFTRCFELPRGENVGAPYVALGNYVEPSDPFDSLFILKPTTLRWEKENSISLPLTVEEVFTLPVSDREFCQWSSARIESWLREQWDNPHSELRLAAWWAELGTPERDQFLQERMAGYEELRRVTHWICVFEEKCVQGVADWLYQYRPAWLEKAGDSVAGQANRRYSPFERRLGEVLVTHLLSLTLEGWDVVPRCVQHYIHSALTLPFASIAPSQHEWMEASLNLRDWLRGQMSEGEFEELWGLSREIEVEED